MRDGLDVFGTGVAVAILQFQKRRTGRGSNRMSSNHSDDKDTKLALSPRLKQQFQDSSNGTRPSHWLFHESQMFVQADRQVGGFRGERNLDVAKSQHECMKHDWLTREGSAIARDRNTMKRFLPKATWNKFSGEERQPTPRKNSSYSEQPVASTPTAKRERSYVIYGDPRTLNEEQLKRLTKTELVQIARSEDLPNRSKMNKAQLARTLRRHFRQPS